MIEKEKIKKKGVEVQEHSSTGEKMEAREGEGTCLRFQTFKGEKL